MIGTLLSHEWQKSVRSPRWGKTLAIKIFLGFLGLYLLLNFLVIGLALDKILENVFPNTATYDVVNQWLIYYLLGDLVFRFLLQDIPTAGLLAYLHLPIDRGKLLHFQLLRSHANIFNLLPLLIVVPFGLIGIWPKVGGAEAFFWIFSAFCLILINHQLAFRLKVAFSVRPMVVVGLLLGIVLFGWLDYQGYLSLGKTTGQIFGFPLQQPFWGALWLLVPMLLYGLNWSYLRRHAYLDSDASQKAVKEKKGQASGSSALAGFFVKLGMDPITAEMLQLEWRLIRRNKRPWQTFLLSLFFLLYGLLTFSSMEMEWFSLFVAVFITGIFSINHGQFTVSWEGSYFDYLLTSKISIKNFFLMKYRIFAVSNVIYFIASLFYIFIIPNFWPFLVTGFFFNLGFSSLMVIVISSMNSTPIDLGRSTFMNYQGVQATQFLFALLVIGLPMLVYIPLNSMEQGNLALIILSGLGMLGAAFHTPIIKAVAANFQNRRYKTAEKMRQN